MIKNKLTNNFIYLVILQGTNYLLPLITFTYLARVLGIDGFGLMSFAIAMVGYFIILTDYGFNLTATKDISVYRDDKNKLIEIFSSVMIIKLSFALIGFIVFLAIIISFNKFSKHYLVFILSYLLVIGKVLFPNWFFIGFEEMKYITILNLIEKLIFTFLIFILINSKEDLYKIFLINSLGTILIGFIAIYIIRIKYGIFIKKQKLKTIIFYLKDGWHLFISNIAISLYTITTTFVLGLFTNDTIVGYFAAADKIRAALQNIFLTPFSQTVYPYISKKVNESKQEGMKFLKKILYISTFVLSIISVILFVLAKDLIFFLLGENYERSVLLLKIMAVLPLIIGLSNIFGIQVMITFGMKKAFSKILIAGSILNFVLLFMLIPSFKDVGAAVTVTIVEIFITAAMFVYLQKRGIKILKGTMDV